MTAVVEALADAPTTEEAVARALALVRERFGWAYASYWQVDPADRALHFVQESGDAGEEFRAVTLAASFREGVGLAGRAWRARDLCALVEHRFGVRYCESGMLKLLKGLDLSWQKARPIHPEADPKAQERFTKRGCATL